MIVAVKMSSVTRVVIVLVCCLTVVVVHCQQCSLDRVQQCKEDLERLIRLDGRTFRGQEVNTHCNSIRDNMQCLMWHSANCLPRDQQQQSGDRILAGKAYLDRYCDVDRGWRVSRCFQYDDVKRCEAQFVSGGKPIAADTCRSYVVFKNCVKDVISRRCSRDDEHFLVSYLIDRARDLTWQCGGSSDAKDVHAVYKSSSSPAGYAPYTQDSYCMIRAAEFIQECARDYQRRQYNARRYYSDDRVREVCCANIEYRECVRGVLQERCRDAGSVVIDSILYQHTREQDYECREFNLYRCAGCAVTFAKSLIVLCLSIALLRFYSSSEL